MIDDEREAFERAIAANVYDADTRRVYSDWLEEHGFDDEAAEQRRMATDAWRRAREYVEACAAECETSFEDVMHEAALAAKDASHYGITCYGFDTPSSMSCDVGEFWKAYEVLTGETLNEEQRERTFVGCSC